MKSGGSISSAVIIVLLVIAIFFSSLASAVGYQPNLNRGLVLHFKFNNQSQYGEGSKNVHDFSGNKNNGTVISAKWNKTGGPFRDGAFEFDGFNDLITIADSHMLSPSKTGKFTVTFWVKFARTKFVGEGSQNDYLYFLGKGDDDNHEFAFRQYNRSNAEDRDNRVSFYIFNLDGGLGAGSYFQDPIRLEEWMYITAAYNGSFVDIWKNGVLMDSSDTASYDVMPGNGNAPLNIGTLDQDSYLRGSIDELRIYNRTLTSEEINLLYSG